MNDEQKKSEDMIIGADGTMSENITEESSSTQSVDSGALVDTSLEIGSEVPVDNLVPPPLDTPLEITETVADKSSTAQVVVQTEETVNGINEHSGAGVVDTSYSTLTPIDSDHSTAASAAAVQVLQPQLKHEHRNNKKLLAFVVFFAGLILAGAAVYVYLSTENNAEEVQTQVSTSSQETVTPEIVPATETDVDKVTQELDQTLEQLNDSEDFSEEALTDQALEL